MRRDNLAKNSATFSNNAVVAEALEEVVMKFFAMFFGSAGICSTGKSQEGQVKFASRSWRNSALLTTESPLGEEDFNKVHTTCARV